MRDCQVPATKEAAGNVAFRRLLRAVTVVARNSHVYRLLRRLFPPTLAIQYNLVPRSHKFKLLYKRYFLFF